MENTTNIIHCFQNQQIRCKFKFIMMTLKLQTLSDQNVVFISLDAYILHSAIYHHV